MKITIHGCGYVGLVSGACFAELGHDVICVDINSDKIQQLNQGTVPIYEPGLEKIIKKQLQCRLSFTSDTERAIHHSQLQFICVNTPTTATNGADISQVLTVAETIANTMLEYKLIVNKSTVPVGTANKVYDVIARTLSKQNKVIKYDVASNPEFLKEGAAINDFMEPDRVIIGSSNAKSQELLAKVYQKFSERIVFMDRLSAELTKYAANAILATKISFMNELANIAEKVGADIEQIKYGIGLDRRIGPHFINAGCGYGGSCFPKDVRALSFVARENDINPLILDAVEKVNEQQKQKLFTKINAHFQGNLTNKVIALWGLAFKPHTDDIREAPSLVLIKQLIQAGVTIQTYDPNAMPSAKKLLNNYKLITFCNSAKKALKNADALIIVTEWDEFKSFDLNIIKTDLNKPVIFDGRNIYSASQMKELDIEYFSIGR